MKREVGVQERGGQAGTMPPLYGWGAETSKLYTRWGLGNREVGVQQGSDPCHAGECSVPRPPPVHVPHSPPQLTSPSYCASL